MTNSEQKIFNEIMVDTKWQDYLCEKLNSKWEEYKKEVNNISYHDSSYHTSQGANATIAIGSQFNNNNYGKINDSQRTGNYNRGGVDYPIEQYNEAINIKNGLNGLIFTKTKNSKYFKYKINKVINTYEYLSIGVICENDNRIEKNMILKSVQVLYREDIKKYIIIMLYDSKLRNESNIQVMKIVHNVDDIINNVLEGDNGFINFINMGYRSMDIYESSIGINNEIVSGKYVAYNNNSPVAGNQSGMVGGTWGGGYYYGGYWYHGLWDNGWPDSYWTYNFNNYCSWVIDNNYWTKENRNIVIFNKNSNSYKLNFETAKPFTFSESAKNEFFGKHPLELA